ncbi:efflux RND transporter periplasmic adaptor subunit [Caulobacter segnis]
MLTAVAVSSLLAAGVGALVGKTMLSSPPKEAAAAEAKEEHAGEKPHVGMTADRIAADGIQLVTLTGGGLDAAVSAQATVVATPNGAAILAARADGAIVRINKRLGDPVAAGEVIAAIESRDAAAISADRSTAAAKAAAARQALVREQRLFEAKITARQDLGSGPARSGHCRVGTAPRQRHASAAAGVSGNGRTLAVTSPISGRITAATATLGAYVTAGSELFRVADPGRIEIQAALPVADAQRVKPGDTAVLESASGPVNATVRSITPALDAENRSATAVLAVSGQAPMLTPGQALRARITPVARPRGRRAASPRPMKPSRRSTAPRSSSSAPRTASSRARCGWAAVVAVTSRSSRVFALASRSPARARSC